MTGYSGTRHRTSVLRAVPPEPPAEVSHSLARFCRVCGGRRVVLFEWLIEPRGGGPMACPHCSNGRRPVPTHEWPLRDENPRGVA